MDFTAFKNAVLAKAEALGIVEYELYYQAEESTSVSVFQHEINQFSASTEGGVCFRCIVNGKMGYASTEELSLAEAESLVVRAKENAEVLEAEEAVFLCEGGKQYHPLELKPYPLPATEELISTALSAQDKLYAADPAVVDGTSTQAISACSSIAIVNSKGLDLQYQNNLAGLVVGAVVSDGKEMVNDYQIKLAKLDTIDTENLADKAVKGALRKLGGDVPPTGVCPVVFDPEAMSNLLATFSRIFSAETAQKGLSKLADKEGRMIASPAVTLVDDPFYKDSPMPIPFDAEGCPTRTKNVIEAGKLNTLLYNLKTAAVAGKETTGNASKAGYSASVRVQPFTMYLAGGELTEDELLARAGNGVYINSLGGLHAGADPVSGDFSLQSAGFMIENGVKTTAVKSFTVAGNFYDLLQNITAVANNTQLPKAMGITAYGAPSVLVENLSIAGK